MIKRRRSILIILLTLASSVWLVILTVNYLQPAYVLPDQWAALPGEHVISYYFDPHDLDYTYNVESRVLTLKNPAGEVGLELTNFKQTKVDLIFSDWQKLQLGSSSPEYSYLPPDSCTYFRIDVQADWELDSAPNINYALFDSTTSSSYRVLQNIYCVEERTEIEELTKL